MPDAEPTTAGVMTDCDNLIPSERGMKGAPSPIPPVSVGALAAECRGAVAIMQLAGTRRVFAGTQTKMYELTGTTWTDRSRAGNYTGSTENRWSFAQFGDFTLASNDTEVIQASASGAFADIATAPKARIIVAVADFVLAFNTIDGTYGDSPDRWWCSAIRDHTSWTPSVTTQANTGRLVDGGGQIVAAARLGSQVVAFKESAMYVGTYAGSPVVWQWDRMPGDVGCLGPEAVCEVAGTALAFAGGDNFYLHDGTRPVAIGTGSVRQWFADNSSPTSRYRTMAVFERQNMRVWFMFPGRESTGACDKALVYHVTQQRWGRCDRTVEAPLIFATPGIVWDDMGTLYPTWDSLPAIPYDSTFWLGGGAVFSLFDASHQLQNLVGESAASGFTTGDQGDDEAVTFIRRLRLRFLTKPATATVVGATRQGLGDGFMPGAGSSLTDSSGFDLRQSGRWHRLTFDFTGEVEFNAMSAEAELAGNR